MKNTSHEVDFIFKLEVSYLRNKFLQRILASLALIALGSLDLFFNASAIFLFAYVNIIIGIVILGVSTISYIKYKSNPGDVDKELSKEYDERDDLIDGKVAKFTLNVLVYLILIILFLSNLISISASTALVIILLSLIITEPLSRTYYNHQF